MGDHELLYALAIKQQAVARNLIGNAFVEPSRATSNYRFVVRERVSERDSRRISVGMRHIGLPAIAQSGGQGEGRQHAYFVLHETVELVLSKRQCRSALVAAEHERPICGEVG